MADDLSPLGEERWSKTAKDYVSKPVLGREGHGLLYGDEVPIGGKINPSAGVAAFAEAVATPEPTVPTQPAADGTPTLSRWDHDR